MRNGRSLKGFAAAVIATAPFLRALSGGWVNWDDGANFSPSILGLGLGPRGWRWIISGSWGTMSNYEPAAWLFRLLEAQLFGLEPFAFHAASLLLHAAVVWLFFRLAWELLVSARIGLESAAAERGAFLSALLFGLHPLRAEAAAWVSADHHLLALLFLLLSALAYLRACAGAGSVWKLLSLGAYALSLLSFPLGLAWPALLLVLDAHPLGRLNGLKDERLRGRLIEKLPYAALAALAGAAALACRGDKLAAAYAEPLIPLQAAGVGWAGLGRMVWPLWLAPVYPPSAPWTRPSLLLAAGAASFLLVSGLLWRGRARAPGLWTAWAFYWLALLPVLSSGLSVIESGASAGFDRYLALPSMGWALLAGGVLAGSRRALPLLVLGGFIGVSWAGLDWRQCGFWSDSLALWSRETRLYPDSALAQNNRGGALTEGGRIEEAVAAFRRAVELEPGYPRARRNLCKIYVFGRRWEEAIEACEVYRRLVPSDSWAFDELGVAQANLARLPEAQETLEAAARLAPGDPAVRYNLGVVLERRGRPREAEKAYRESLALDTAFEPARDKLDALLRREP